MQKTKTSAKNTDYFSYYFLYFFNISKSPPYFNYCLHFHEKFAYLTGNNVGNVTCEMNKTHYKIYHLDVNLICNRPLYIIKWANV